MNASLVGEDKNLEESSSCLNDLEEVLIGY